MLISTQLRPRDVVRFGVEHYALAPIAGLQMAEGAVEIGELLLVRCNRAEWESVEHAVAFEDWHASYYEANPVFLLRPLAAAVAPDQVEPVLDAIIEDAARLITAMRLYKTGPLIEPSYTVGFVASGAMTYRRVGPYRSEFLAMPLDGRTWPLEAHEAEDLAALAVALKEVERITDADTLRAAIDQLTLSHSPAAPDFFMVQMLLIALEMLFGSQDRALELATSRYERALQLLRWSEVSEIDPGFETFYLQGIHPLRNALQHYAGDARPDEIADARFRLQLAVMMGVRLTMLFHRAREALARTAQTLGWGGRPPRDLLSAGLDRAFRGNPAPFDTLVAVAKQVVGRFPGS